MKPHKVSLREIFGGDVRYEVPRYQRPYVWEREKHWEPLWNDIELLYDGSQNGDSRRHFLGAIVLKKRDSVPGGVGRWRVIDGQQRLTTLQLLLAAAVNAAAEVGADGAAKLLGKLVRNDAEVASDEDEILKIHPTDADRSAFNLVMAEGGPPPDAPDDPSNSIQEAYAYFGEAVRAWALDAGTDPDALATRYKELYGVLGDLLQLVSINLDDDDDAQIIFETLNARGTPLLAIDLVKNAVLDRARAQGADQDKLHDELWAPELGLPYWREEVRQGRLTRPRAEGFLNYWLVMRLGQQVNSDELFQVFRQRMLDAPDAPPAADVLDELRRHAEIMRGFDDLEPNTAGGRFFRTLRALDSSAVLPLALRLFADSSLDDARRDRALAALESYLVRRMLRGLTTKNYTRLTIETVKAGMTRDDPFDEVIVDQLCASGADSSRWPTDEGLVDHLGTQALYSWLGRSKIELVLSEVELELRSNPLVEDIHELPRKLSIEHIMPREWATNWPLPAGDPEEMRERREAMINLLGNLTLVTGSLNSSLSNQSWAQKNQRLGENTILLLNQRLAQIDVWDEAAIAKRGRELAVEICKRWPGPRDFKPDYDPSLKPPPSAETSPEAANLTEAELEAIVENATPLFAVLLKELAAASGQPRTFEMIEDQLGWSRGRLAAVLGGYGNWSKNLVGGKRPYRAGKDEDGYWWLWLDEERSKTLSNDPRIESASEGIGTPVSTG